MFSKKDILVNNSINYFICNESPEAMWAERTDSLLIPFFGIRFYGSLIKACEKVRKNITEFI